MSPNWLCLARHRRVRSDAPRLSSSKSARRFFTKREDSDDSPPASVRLKLATSNLPHSQIGFVSHVWSPGRLLWGCLLAVAHSRSGGQLASFCTKDPRAIPLLALPARVHFFPREKLASFGAMDPGGGFASVWVGSCLFWPRRAIGFVSHPRPVEGSPVPPPPLCVSARFGFDYGRRPRQVRRGQPRVGILPVTTSLPRLSIHLSNALSCQ